LKLSNHYISLYI